MANQQHLDIIKFGIESWNKWRDQNPEIRPEFEGADFTDAYLIGANLNGANLVGARLNGANLSYSQLSNADLSYAEVKEANFNNTGLYEANLRSARFVNANLENANLNYSNCSGVRFDGANLKRANLSNVNLNNATLNGADLTNATLGWTVLGNVDLSITRGLDKIVHEGPSEITISTIYSSKGNIPDIFLRRAGVPENLIAYLPSLTGKAFEFYSCFISHSSKDKRFCERLYADLLASGVRVWYFPEDARWGESVWGEIDRSIKIYDRLVVVCSKNSLQSGPVQREIERSLNREDKEKKNVLFPIRIDNYVFDSWEHERKDDVLKKVIGDFTGWNRGAKKYDTAFQKLLRDLQANYYRSY